MTSAAGLATVTPEWTLREVAELLAARRRKCAVRTGRVASDALILLHQCMTCLHLSAIPPEFRPPTPPRANALR